MKQLQVYCNTVPILPLLSFFHSHFNILPLVIVLFGFENQPDSQDFLQLVTVLCFSPVYWWSSQNTHTTQTSSPLSLGPIANATDVPQPLRLIVLPYPPIFLGIPTSAARCLHTRNDTRDPSNKRRNYVGEKVLVILPNNNFHAI